MHLQDLRSKLAAADETLAERFWRGDDIDALIAARTKLLDEVIVGLWNGINWPTPPGDNLALFAVGGYGRGELHPYSDIDLLVLGAGEISRYQAGLEWFVQNLWDLKLDIGHSVRTVDDCRRDAADDLTTATALLERRLLAGPISLDRRLGELFAVDEIWPSGKFFRAKRDEQNRRHARFENTEYNLEPNVKSSPGGLRDIQTVDWIMRRHFGNARLEEQGLRGFLTPDESTALDEGRRFLWRVRYGLHLLAGRKEDRLLFDYQRTLAERFGYVDTEAQLAVEQFMHDYYRRVLTLTEVNDVLLQHFDETILRAHYAPEIEPINERFRIRDNYIETTTPEVFQRQPSALMEMFVIMANRRDIAGVRATTIRAVRNSVDLIDDNFRNDPAIARLFIELLKAPYTLVTQLTRMRRYGVLGRYIPEYGRVIGQMQHDLFHIYTVDAHTMMVIRNMRRFRYRSAKETFPVANHCVANLPKIELLYIAGLFHDIGKGRGGDHSELGAQDAVAFCRRHQLNDSDTQLVEWLVRIHLLMSSTAQRQDINDPEVVHAFANQVRNQTRLDYLYTLTVADINATNPTLWNGWRATLMRQLYVETRKALRRGLESPIDRDQYIEDVKVSALEKLADKGVAAERAWGLWGDPDPEFFLRHSPSQIVNITQAMDRHDLSQGPLVLIQDLAGRMADGVASEIFVYTLDHPYLFAASALVIDELGLSIHDARVQTTSAGLSLNSYIVLDAEGHSIGDDPPRKKHICDTLTARLATPQDNIAMIRKRIPRRLKQFARATEVEIEPGEPYAALRIIASDRPGLLGRIGLIFLDLGLAVHNARITTLGERVEDTFFVTESDGSPIGQPERIGEITDQIRVRIDQAMAAEATV